MQTILPVIVIYRIRLSQAASYTSLIRAAGISRFVVYDNSPADFEQEDIAALCPEALYVRDTANSGLPRAYNLAARKAEEWGYTRVLLLDQDTTFPPEAWHCYQHAAGYTGVTAPLAVTAQGQTFSPYDPSVRRRTPAGLSAGEYSLHRFYVINSGMCVPVALFKQTGGYNERITLDFSDFQFLMHVRTRPASSCSLSASSRISPTMCAMPRTCSLASPSTCSAPPPAKRKAGSTSWPTTTMCCATRLRSRPNAAPHASCNYTCAFC